MIRVRLSPSPHTLGSRELLSPYLAAAVIDVLADGSTNWDQAAEDVDREWDEIQQRLKERQILYDDGVFI